VKLILALSAALALAGLADIVDTLTPGGPHFPHAVPVAVAVAAFALGLVALLIGLRAGIQPFRRNGGVVPLWFRLVTLPVFLAYVVLTFRGHDNLVLPFLGFWVALGVGGQTLGLMRLRRSGPQFTAPPGPGPNRLTR
jgi:hypothetical protein